MTERRSISLPLCLLGAGAVHGLCVAALLPMLITLPGPGSGQRGPAIIDVEVLPGPASTAPEAQAEQGSARSHQSDPPPMTATGNPSGPTEPGKTEHAPASTSASHDAREPAAPPAPPDPSPTVVNVVPPAATPDEAAPSKSDSTADAAAPAAPPEQAAPPTFHSSSDAFPAAAAPPQAEPLPSTPTIAEVPPPADADPVTTQSTTPLLEKDQAGEGSAKEAESTESGSSDAPQDADRFGAPPVSKTPEDSPSVARAEPASPAPSATELDTPELDTPAATATEPIPQAKPKAKAPAKAQAPTVRKHATALAKRAVVRALRPARAKTQAPVNRKGGFLSLFGGAPAAPSANAASSATGRATIQH